MKIFKELNFGLFLEIMDHRRSFLLPLMNSLFLERAGDMPITRNIDNEYIQFSGSLIAEFQIPPQDDINERFQVGYRQMGAKLISSSQTNSVIKYSVNLNVDGEVPLQEVLERVTEYAPLGSSAASSSSPGLLHTSEGTGMSRNAAEQASEEPQGESLAGAAALPGSIDVLSPPSRLNV